MIEITFLKALLLTSIWPGLVILDYYLTARAQGEHLRNASEIL